MLSLAERIELLESDLKADPPRISVYHDLPFAILRYNPDEEWSLRGEARRLATRLEAAGKRVHRISLAEVLWEVIDRAEGPAALERLEQERGFAVAQAQVTTYLVDPDWYPLTEMLLRRIAGLTAERDVVFLERAGTMAPGIYHMSKLLDELQGHTQVPIILFYPGTLVGTTGLRFMDLDDREVAGNYRVKIYG